VKLRSWSPVLLVLPVMLGCQSEAPTSPSVAAAPRTSTISPASGTGLTQTFSVVFSDSEGVSQITVARVLFNAAIDGRQACYVYFERDSGSLLLVNDSGEGSSSQPLGGKVGLENSQCRVDAGGSSVTVQGGQLNLNLALAFKRGFSGPKNVYLAVEDKGGKSTGFQARGTWTVP
jgi:hypothetical protein